jgi:hypothetical protein
MWTLARNCNTPNYNIDWLGEKDDGPETCRDLSATFAEHNLTFVANEYSLIAEGLCPQFWNIMVFRHPVARIISHLSMLHSDRSWGEQWEPYRVSYPPTTPEAVFTKLPIIVNNYYIRALLGGKVFRLPFGAVNETHLEQAKRIIDGLDVVFIMNETNQAALSSSIRRLLGFKMETKVVRGGETDKYRTMLNWSSAQWDALEAANSLDLQLFEYATALYKLDEIVFSHPAFSNFSARMPNRDCGYSCKKDPGFHKWWDSQPNTTNCSQD